MRPSVVMITALAGCWTGSATPASTGALPTPRSEHEPSHVRIKLERTACFGTCPTYSVVLHADGHVEWRGEANVKELGSRTATISPKTFDNLLAHVDRIRFFERDQFGELPLKPECTTSGNTTTCSFGAAVEICSDTSHSIITVWRGTASHRIDTAHCATDPSELDELEEHIATAAQIDRWIGP